MIDLVVIHNILALASGVALAAASIIKPLVDLLRRHLTISGWRVLALVFALGQIIVWLIMLGVGVDLSARNAATFTLAGILASQIAVGITKAHDSVAPPRPAIDSDLSAIYQTVKHAVQDQLNGDEFGGRL